jgi:acetoin utilization protein AcuB
MRLQEIMTTAVLSIGEDARVDEARERMKRERVRHLVVLDGRRIVGVLSERDLHHAPGAASVRDVMTTRVVTATPYTTVREAANLLRGRSIGCLPLVDGERMVGLITITDLLDLIGRGVEKPVEQHKRWTLKHRGPRRRRAVT